MLATLLTLALPAPDIPIAPILRSTYAPWTAEGNAFTKGPASGKTLRQLEISHNRSEAVITSEKEGDQPTGTLTSPEFTIERPFIAFRIGGGDYRGTTCINLIIEGKLVRTATGHRSDVLAPTNWDVKQYRNQKAQIQIVDLEQGDWGHINVDNLTQTDTPEKAPWNEPLYQEQWRPQVHVTARYWNDKKVNPVEHQEGWINDLNGLIYYEGEYHMFAQRWATCWLHFVSKDLVHWTELEPAFFEESHRSGIQSGTTVIDYKNTSGLGKDPKNPPMIAFWSRFDNKSQCLHYSLDKGRTWTFYPKNPFMTKPERDPKVFWYEPGGHWVMVMYGDGKYHILNSKNLLDWQDTGHPIPNSFECPDMFELPIDGDAKNKKWVLIQGSGEYTLGSFDGKQFKEESPRLTCDLGPNFYATQSWHNMDTGDGRRVQAAWMRGSRFPNMPFSQQVSFPCELTLRTTKDGLRVFRQPIAELAKLHAGEAKRGPISLKPGRPDQIAEKGDLFRIRCLVSIPEGAKLEFDIRGEKVTIERQAITNGTAKSKTIEPITEIELLIDRASVELFVNKGELSSTRFVLPEGTGISMKAEGGEVTVQSLVLNPLKSIWPRPGS